MIVEYFGIPGCGKTYHANLYKNELKRKGLSYIDLSRWKGTPVWLKIFYKFADKIFLFIPKYRELRNKFKELCKDAYGKIPKYLPFSVDYCIDRIISTLYVQYVFGRNKSIAINDEGLMQWVVFLSVLYDISVESLLDILSPLNSNCKNAYKDTPIEVAFENIKKRNRHVCPMDELEEKQLLNYLSDFEKGCRAVLKYLNNNN